MEQMLVSAATSSAVGLVGMNPAALFPGPGYKLLLGRFEFQSFGWFVEARHGGCNSVLWSITCIARTRWFDRYFLCLSGLTLRLKEVWERESMRSNEGLPHTYPFRQMKESRTSCVAFRVEILALDFNTMYSPFLRALYLRFM